MVEHRNIFHPFDQFDWSISRAYVININKIFNPSVWNIGIYIEPKVEIFSEAEGRGKYSLLRMQYMPVFHKEGF